MSVPSRRMIRLNGRLLPLVPWEVVTKVDIVPFAGKITSGDPKYGDFALASHQVYRDFRSGMGLLNARPDKSGKYWHSTLNTRFPYQITMLPQSTSVSLALGAPYNGNRDYVSAWGEIGTRVVAGVRGSLLYSTSATNFSSSSSLIGNGHRISKFVNYSPPGVAETCFAFTIPEDGGSGVTGPQYYHSIDGVSWEIKTQPGGGFTNSVYAALEFDRKLVAFTDTGIFWSTNPSAAVPTWNTLTTAIPGTVYSAVVYIDEEGSEAIYFLTATTLYRLNWNSGTWSKIRDFDGGLINTGLSNAIGTTLCIHNGAIMIPARRGILRWTPTTQTWIGPSKDDGFETGWQGFPQVLLSDGENLISNIIDSSAANAPNLVVYDEFGWHRLWGHIINGAYSTTGYITNVWRTSKNTTSGFIRYYVNFYDAVQTIMKTETFELPIYSDNPLVLSGSRYQSLGDIITPWDDCGFAEIPKGAYELSVNYKLQDANNIITIYYATDRATSWTQLGTCSNSDGIDNIVKTFKFGLTEEGLPFRFIRFKISMNRNGAASTVSPTLFYFTLKYIPRPTTRFSFNHTIDMTNEAALMAGFSGLQEMREFIDTCRESVILLDYQDNPDATVYQVLVATKPESYYWDDDNSQYKGVVNLTVTQVL